jgi:hypothetical protein
MTLPSLRMVIVALIALFSTSPIITVMAGAALSSKHPGILPGLSFVFLGVIIAMPVDMIFLVISEAFMPGGSLPGPLYVLRGTRRLVDRGQQAVIQWHEPADYCSVGWPQWRPAEHAQTRFHAAAAPPDLESAHLRPFSVSHRRFPSRAR